MYMLILNQGKINVYMISNYKVGEILLDGCWMYEESKRRFFQIL